MAQEFMTMFNQPDETTEEKRDVSDVTNDANSSGEFTSRISAAFAKKISKRGLYEGIRHEESFELSTNIFDHTSYNYMTTESLYSTKSSKPHSDVPTVNQVCIYLVN